MVAAVEIDLVKNVCNFSWEIENWTWIMENDDLLSGKKFYFDVDECNFVHRSKWEVGFSKHPTQPEYLQYYWILKEYDGKDKFPVLISFQITQHGENIGSTYKVLKYAKLNSTNTVDKGIPLDKMWWLKNWLSRFDPITIKISMQIMPINELPNTITSELLDDEASSDLLICTSDAMELKSHQVILMEKWPAFLETHSMSVDNKFYLKTITGKTMRILLRYIYTGELDSTWQDEDIIIEFIKAAGRYQMVALLNTVDNVLGKDTAKIAKNCDVLLLPLMKKYSLRNAESTILSRIVKTVNHARMSDDLFDLFGYERPKDVKSTTSPKIAKVLDVWNELRKLPEASFRDVILLGLAEKLHLREMENQLLDKIKTTVKKISSGQQLSELFGKGEEFESGVVEILKEAYGI